MPPKLSPRNPYIAGKALGDERGFFGREDVFRMVRDALSSQDQNAIVLFGQRRIGKTSILLQMRRRLPSPPFHAVYFDLMDQARKPLGTVLYELAATINAEFGQPPPRDADFTPTGEYFQEKFLPTLYQSLGADVRPVLLFDEFDVLDVAAEEKLDPTAAARTFFPYLRRLMESQSRLAFIFVVGRKVEDLAQEFMAAFKSARHKRVSVLDDESARQLVGLAERDGSLHFTGPAVDRLLSLTARHPLYTQLMCQLLFDRAYTAFPPDTPTVDVADVDAVIPKTLEAGEHFFEWVWGGLPPAERVIFSAVAGATIEKPLITEDELANILQSHGIRILIRELELAPKTLIEWEMLRRADGGYSFFIELMRRWVAERKPLPKVKDELDRVNPIAEQQYQLGHTFYRLGQLKEAVAPLQAALQVNPNHLKARLLLGEALREQGAVDEAVQQLEEAFRYDSDATRYPLVRALLAQGETVEKAGQEDAVLNIYARVLEISPNETVARDRRQAIFIARGDRALQVNDFDAAITAYREVGADQKVAAVLVVQRKRALEASAAAVEPFLQREDWDKAAEIYSRLIELDQEDRRWTEGLARVEQEQGIARRYAEGLGAMQQSKWAEAQRAFADVVHDRPDYKEAAEQLAAATRQAKAKRETPKAQETITSSSGTAREQLSPIAVSSILWRTGDARAFWIRWVTATTVGWILARSVGIEILLRGGPDVLVHAIYGVFLGGLVGTAQWYVLRSHVPRAGWWVVASTVGEALGRFVWTFLVVAEVFYFYHRGWESVLLGGLVGTAVGTAQWVVLRPNVPRAGWWVVASIVGRALSVAVSVAVEAVYYTTWRLIIDGAISGMITGAVLVWLLGQRISAVVPNTGLTGSLQGTRDKTGRS